MSEEVEEMELLPPVGSEEGAGPADDKNLPKLNNGVTREQYNKYMIAKGQGKRIFCAIFAV